MLPPLIDKSKQALVPSRDSVAAARKVLEDLLTSQISLLGVSATGYIESAETPSLVSGTSAKGRPYKFWTRRIKLKVSIDGQTVTVAQTRDDENLFPKLDFDSVVTFKIGSARMDGPVMILRELDPR